MGRIGHRNDIQGVAAASGLRNVSFNKQGVDAACLQHHRPDVAQESRHHDRAVGINAPPLCVRKAAGADEIKINFRPCRRAEPVDIRLVAWIEGAGNWNSGRQRRCLRQIDQSELEAASVVAAGGYLEGVTSGRQVHNRISGIWTVEGSAVNDVSSRAIERPSERTLVCARIEVNQGARRKREIVNLELPWSADRA